ncbi:MAG: phage tail protein [Campylobacteraceae bacterium]|jgi:phage protein D|nr:phage tail protein [Campylobacteraceae bacterium]
MVRKPTFSILIGGIDGALIVSKNLISLSYEDKEGDESDELSLELAGIYEKKPFGTKIEASIGYEGDMFYCGSFTIQTIAKNYTANTTNIRATSVNFASAEKEKKNETWTDTNLYDVAMKIAERNNLSYSIDESAKNSPITSKLQQTTGDLGFLNALCADKGFMYSKKDNTIMIKPRTAANETITKAVETNKIDKTFKISDLSEFEITDANRNVYDTVLLSWHDETDGQDKTLKVGNGVQILNKTINEPKSDAEAVELANALLKQSQKGGITGSFTAVGQEIRTGWIVKIEEVGEFLVKSVSHSLTSSNFTSSCEIEG